MVASLDTVSKYIDSVAYELRDLSAKGGYYSSRQISSKLLNKDEDAFNHEGLIKIILEGLVGVTQAEKTTLDGQIGYRSIQKK